MDWFANIDRADKLTADLVIYLVSIASFALMPAHFGRKVWVLVAWFIALNLAYIFDLWGFLNWEGPVLFVILGQLPWILFVLDLLFHGKLSEKLLAVPMKELILWQTTRIMGLHFVLAIYGGYAPEKFGLQTGFSEIVTGIGGLILYFAYRPGKGWYRTWLIFWNTYGLISVLSAEFKILFSNPQIPYMRFTREIFQYISFYPQNWVYSFWFPIAIGMHAAVFYKLYHAQETQSP